MVQIRLKVIPKASRDRVLGWMGERLKVAVTAAPERGRANEAVVDLLAATLGVPRRRIRITAGETSALKTVVIDAPTGVLDLLPAR